MGLDMYLTKRTFVPHDGRNKVKITGAQEHVLNERIKSISEDVGYWRKSNQIHKWFVDNVQNGEDDCGEYDVSREQLQDLLDLCLEVQGKPELASELLPTTEGFFFGSTEYDKWYKEDIDHTVKLLKRLLAEEVDFWTTYSYQSSW